MKSIAIDQITDQIPNPCYRENIRRTFISSYININLEFFFCRVPNHFQIRFDCETSPFYLSMSHTPFLRHIVLHMFWKGETSSLSFRPRAQLRSDFLILLFNSSQQRPAATYIGHYQTVVTSFRSGVCFYSILTLFRFLFISYLHNDRWLSYSSAFHQRRPINRGNLSQSRIVLVKI